MSEPLSFEALRVGDSWESRGRTITEADVGNFAGLTGDFDPLHVDREFAGKSPFGRRIAHGLLGLSILAGLSSTNPAVQTEAFLGIHDWRFQQPIFPGDTVRARTEVVSVEATSKRRGKVTWKRALLNQRNEIVQSGLFETMVRMNASGDGRCDRGTDASVVSFESSRKAA